MNVINLMKIRSLRVITERRFSCSFHSFFFSQRTGGAAEKTGALKAGDLLLEVNGNDVTRMSRIEAWSFMKKLHDGEVNLLVRHPATKSS